MITDEIRKELFRLKDDSYRDFQSRLIPSIVPDSMIGVRTPELRALAKRLSGMEDIGCFLDDLPHRYFDENQLHAFIISGIKDYDRCMAEVGRFLPFVNNWATCDQMSPKVFARHKPELRDKITVWLNSGETYTVRFALRMLMVHFLDGDFSPEYLELAAGICADEYYIRMMVAWYFATALAKQYAAALPYIERKCLDSQTHNRAIQKAIDSFRITPEQKAYLKTLRIR